MPKPINVIIETPRGSAEKYDYDEQTGFFILSKILPAGMVFPFDFGFIPNTKGEDGDPLDIMVISEFHSFPGCMMSCRLIGAIEAKQTEGKQTIRNDRFLAIPEKSQHFQNIGSLEDIMPDLMNEIEHFFIGYNEMEGKVFKPINRLKPKDAFKLIKFNSHG